MSEAKPARERGLLLRLVDDVFAEASGFQRTMHRMNSYE